LKYVEDNLQDITNDMINSNKLIVKKYKNTNIINKIHDLENATESNSPINSVAKTKTNSNSSKELSINDSTNSSESEKTRKKRQELSISANKTINIHNYSIVLTFE